MAIDIGPSPSVPPTADQLKAAMAGIQSAGFDKQLIGSPYLGVVASRCQTPRDFNSGNKYLRARTRHIMRDNVPMMKVVYSNWYLVSQAETPSTAPMLISLGLEYPAGTFTKITWGGAQLGIIPAGGDLESDWFEAPSEGDEFFLRPWIYNSAGITTAPSKQDPTHGDFCEFTGAVLTDTSMGGVITSTNATQAFLPSAIIGYTTKPSVLIVGDSIAYGGVITESTAFDASSDTGIIARPLGGIGVNYINVASASDEAQYAKLSFVRRGALGRYCSHAIVEYGRNDVFAHSRSQASMTVDMQILRAAIPGNVKTLLTTITPSTGSGDATFEPVRTAINAERRLVPAGYAGCIDIASVTGDGTNFETWKSGYSTDGIHPVAAANDAVRQSGIISLALLAR